MKVRKGRRNILELVNEKIVQKIGVIKEETRPHRLKVEVWALSQARSRGINVPRVINYYLDQKGREVLVLERIFGKSLSLNSSKENTIYLFEVGRQLSMLGDIGVNYGWINPVSFQGNSKSWQVFILEYTKTYTQRLIKEGIITENDFLKILHAIGGENMDISTSFLVHRDIRLPNLISDSEGKVWIVDWENVLLGDPLYDLALFGTRYGHGVLWESLKSGYGFDHLLPRYILYEIVGLIGIIDFCRKNNINYKGNLKKLQRLIASI